MTRGCEKRCLFSSLWGVLILGIDFARCQDADLQAAVNACIQESSTGDCKCENGCGNYQGTITAWDVTRVTNMENLFRDKTSFNADISSWDTSQVTTMYYMWVLIFHLIDITLGCFESRLIQLMIYYLLFLE